MNSSSNQTEESAYSLDEWFTQYGVSFGMDIVYVYIITPISLISFLLNSLTFSVLLNNKFNLSVVYSYFRLYIFNSTIISLFLITTFVCNSYRVFSFTNSYEATTYGIYVYEPILCVLYFYSNLLEIFMIIERTEKYLPAKYKFLKKLEFNKVCLFNFLFSILVNFPTFFNWETASDYVKLEDSTYFCLFYWGITAFSESILGKVLTFGVFFVRDFLFLAIKLVLNIFSVISIRKYLAQISLFNIKHEPIPKKHYITKTDRALTKMVIIGSLFTIFENIFFTIPNGYYLFVIDELSGYFTVISYVCIALKHGSNFFLFYFFHHSFRNELKKKLK